MSARWIINQKQFTNNVGHVLNNIPAIAVVKNNAYHYGLEFSVEAFLKNGINAFAVTNLHEALKIRELSNDAMIFLMNPSIDFDILRQNNIQMTLPSLSFYQQYKDSLYGINVHIEYENLLHRSGFKDINEMKTVLEDIRNTENTCHVTGLWTHFGYADEFDVTDYDTEKENWLVVLNELNKSFHFEYIHAQNSASFKREDGLLENHTHIRPGIILYGSRPYSSLPESVTMQSLTVESDILQIRQIKSGESAGYSFQFTAEYDTLLAVASIGYGDGILRKRSQFDCLINGRRYPIRGLMMSHMFIEVDDKVKPGDKVVIYSNEIRIDEYTFKGVGANSEQLSALNHDSLIKEII